MTPIARGVSAEAREAVVERSDGCAVHGIHELTAVGSVIMKTKNELSHERWLPVVGYEGYYCVSNLGRVRRMSADDMAFIVKIIKPFKCGWGYLQVELCANGVGRQHLVHRLVAAAFLGPCQDGKEVNHIDGDKTNNAVENLEYVTHSQNMLHSITSGLRKPARGERNGLAKLSEENVLEIREDSRSMRQIAIHHNISKSSVFAIKHRINWGWLNAS